MYCIKCGTQNDDDSKFCIKCGTDIQVDTGSIKKDIESPKILGNIRLKNRKTLKIIIAIIGLIIIIGAVVIILPKLDKSGNNQDVSGDESDISNDDIAEPIPAQDGQYNPTSDGMKDVVQVSISSTPPNANIYIDGIFKGKTPSNVSLPEGSYNLKMNITGYKSIGTDFNVTYDMERQEISIVFEPIDAP